MKISREATVLKITQEIECWAAETGWKNVAAKVITECSEFQKSAATPRGLNNVEQHIKRVLRGNTDYYRQHALKLLPALLAALPAERRVKLTAPTSTNYLASMALKECTEAVNALLLGAASTHLEKEINEAIDSLRAMGYVSANREN
ncbi:toxin YdaT family protein [Pantoea coffeiphila]|uniref:Uncharacterized protein n=1 Tax=Pantoea coffeiphila TaxID=1465635 RepID=A0A2S9I892_9GAMM|nr:toxin YdaT family protein [Pantoea coffeiphila]PRD14009.1 hypothetical protein CQW29_18575 [Pantoea coffeiphila]